MRLFTLCSYLKTKESYDRWVTRRVWGFRHQISKAKYLKKSVENIKKLQEKFRCTVQNGDLVVSIIRVCFLIVGGNGSDESRVSDEPSCPGIRICLTGEVETSSSPIRLQVPDVWYPKKSGMPAGQNSGCETSGEGGMSQGGPSVCARCRDLSGSTPSGFPKRTCAAMLSGTCEHHTPDDSISYPDMLSGSLTTVSKPCYSPRSAALQWCVRTPCPDIFCHGFQRTLLNLGLLWSSKSYQNTKT